MLVGQPDDLVHHRRPQEVEPLGEGLALAPIFCRLTRYPIHCDFNRHRGARWICWAQNGCAGTVRSVDTKPALSVSPAPTEDEAAAIMAAVEVLWPKPVVIGVPARPRSAWKFSNRWWSQPLPLRRARPWV